MQKPFSFSLTKSVVKSKVCHEKLPDSAISREHETDYIKSIRDTKIESTKPKIQETKEIIIPLIKSKTSVLLSQKQPLPKADISNAEGTPLLNQALEELKTEAKEWNNESGDQSTNFLPVSNITIHNSDNGTDDLDEPEDANYESISITDFGAAILRGMGWKPDDQKKDAKPKEIYVRPKGLGLGADPNVLKKPEQSQLKVSSKEDELVWKIGVYCQVVMGRHASLYGTIESFDGDDGRVVLRTAVSKEVLNIPQHSVKLVTQTEFQKYSKYINKIQADAYKKVSDERMAHEARRKSEHMEESVKRKSTDHSVNYEHREKKPKNIHHRKENSKSESSEKYWVLPGIRVRFIDKNYHRGKYYKEKLEVIDVVSKGICNCRTSEGKLVEDIPFKYLETVVPRDVDSRVVIVKGQYRGQKGKLLEKRSNKQEAVVLIDDEIVVVLTYDDICEKI